ncbi:MAG: hypothetical protein CMC13_00210 [Flavobacteriaceae bacterium]|nr:hypothetical protein [Flavobacteriaceae bacterium]|tara:strand:- start:9799 stop:10314 length:516 start_codon:yes stop_codon:yes gene_type:complete
MRNEEIAYKRGYRVDKTGVVYNSNNEKVITTKNSEGYLIFGTGSRVKKTFKNVAVHRLQAFCLFGKSIYNLQVVRHLDGDKLNNKADNIVLGSYVDNYHDIPKKARKKIISKMAETKCGFDEEQIVKMFKLRKEGLFYRQIAKELNCTQGWVWMILNGKTTYTERINNLKL